VYLPVLIIQRAFSDLLNLLAIIILKLLVQTLCAFVLFAPEYRSFHNFSHSMMSQTLYLIGSYSFPETIATERVEYQIYLILVSVSNFVLLTLFLAIILGHTLDEYDECQELMNNRNFFLDIYEILRNAYERQNRRFWLCDQIFKQEAEHEPKLQIVKDSLIQRIKSSKEPQLVTSFDLESFSKNQQRQVVHNLTDTIQLDYALKEYVEL
jgi:hypothetical protein